MPHTPAWYPGKPESALTDEADTVEVLAIDPDKAVILKTTVICPYCGFRKEETMAQEACVHFYSCTHCGKVLKPIYGDCCVFCSYATDICPNEQRRALREAGDSIRRYVGGLREKIEGGG